MIHTTKDGTTYEIRNTNEPPYNGIAINPWCIFINGMVCGLHFTDKQKAEQWIADHA